MKDYHNIVFYFTLNLPFSFLFFLLFYFFNCIYGLGLPHFMYRLCFNFSQSM